MDYFCSPDIKKFEDLYTELLKKPMFLEYGITYDIEVDNEVTNYLSLTDIYRTYKNNLKTLKMG